MECGVASVIKRWLSIRKWYWTGTDIPAGFRFISTAWMSLAKCRRADSNMHSLQAFNIKIKIF
jgi:hypothetical protein